MTGCRPVARSGWSRSAPRASVEVFPGSFDGFQVGHVGHGAAGGEIGEDDGLVRAGEHVRGFGHEVDAAEDDGLGLGAGPGSVGELEAVAEEVGVFHDLVALVEVAEDDDALAERRFGGADAEVELFGGGVAVLGGQDALAGRVGCDGVERGSAGAVGRRKSVNGPGVKGQARVAGFRGVGGLAGED